MDELADYTDHQFETKLQIEIEQLTKNKQAQESPKAPKLIYWAGNRERESQACINSSKPKIPTLLRLITILLSGYTQSINN